MADETGSGDGAKTRGGAKDTGKRGAARRNAKHSAQKKDPVTIDMEPAAKSAAAKEPTTQGAATKSTAAKTTAPAKSTGATTAAKPTPAKPSAAKPSVTKPSATKPSTSSTDPTKSSDAKSDGKPGTKPAGAAAAATASVAAKPKAPKEGAPKAEAPKAGATPPKPSDAKPAPSTSASAKPEAAGTASRSSTPSVSRSDNATASKATTTPPPAARADNGKGGVGFGGVLGAALLGGAVSLGGAWILGAFEDDTTQIAELRTQVGERITAVEASIPQPSDTTAPDDALSREDVDAAIQAALAGRTAEGTPAEPDPRIATLTDELSATRTRLDELQTAIANAGTGAGDTAGPALAALAARVTDLDGRVNAAPTGPSQSDIQAIADQAAAGQVSTLSGRIDANDGRVASLEGGLDERIANATNKAIEPVQERLTQLSTSLSEQIGAVEQRVAGISDTLETRVSALQTSIQEAQSAATSSAEESVGKVSSQLEAGLEGVRSQIGEQRTALSQQAERLTGIEEQVADTDPERRAATALALANLRTRIDDGEAYETELALVRQTNPKIDLTPLDPTSATGIATLNGLTARFDDVAPRIREAISPAPQAGAGGLLANLRSVVKVKPLDGTPGQDIDATIGAIRRSLDEGDLKGADSAWQSLPEEGRTVSQDWHDALTARTKAKNFLAEALASLIEETGG